jgi:hypothetical protein
MSKKVMGLSLAVAALAMTIGPVVSFAKSVECYGAKGKAAMAKMSAAKCKKLGGSTTKPAEKTDAAAPAAPAAPAADAPAAPATTETPAS